MKPYPSDKVRMGPTPVFTIGDVLRAGVARARLRWWQRLACRVGLHPYPHLLEHHGASCQRCGRSWTL